MIHQFLNKDSKTNWGYIIGYFILFLIAPPFIAIPTIIVYMVTKSHATKSDYYLCFFAIAGYFAAINATKRMGRSMAILCCLYECSRCGVLEIIGLHLWNRLF